MNFCLYRQPKSWHGGWLQLHRLQCMNWKLKTQIQSKNCWTPVTLLQLSPYTNCKARPEDSGYKSSQMVPLAFVYNMNFLLVQAGNKLAWRLATAAWVAKHEPKIEDTNSTKICWTPATPLQLSPYTGCKALPEDSRHKFNQKMLLAFHYNMNFCLYRQPTSWHGAWLQLSFKHLWFVRLSLSYNHQIFISTWIQERSRIRTGCTTYLAQEWYTSDRGWGWIHAAHVPRVGGLDRWWVAGKALITPYGAPADVLGRSSHRSA